jgi:hypothetical protein
MALNGFQCDIELEAPAVPDSVEATGAMHWVCSSLFLEDPGQSRHKKESSGRQGEADQQEKHSVM